MLVVVFVWTVKTVIVFFIVALDLMSVSDILDDNEQLC